MDGNFANDADEPTGLLHPIEAADAWEPSTYARVASDLEQHQVTGFYGKAR
jgi:hypothetical protein